MNSINNKRHMALFRRIILAAVILAAVLITVTPILEAQEEKIEVGTQVNQWTRARTIPGYHPETDPPILISDQNGTVHAFSYQWVGEEGRSPRAIMYNQWTREQGWTLPIDVLLSPLKDDARLLDAFMDESGMVHVLFFGGDGDGANVYYSKAPIMEAGQANSWSEPVFVGPRAKDPEDGILAGDNQGNLLILYSGEKYGNGWYMVTSEDNGNSWSESTLMFPTYDNSYSPFFLKTHLGASGLLHTVWSVNDIANHGTAIFYANYDFITKEWREPVTLAEQEDFDSLGTQVPNIVEYDESLFVMYYDHGVNSFVRSDDGGQSWSDPITPFPHVGLNGETDFVVDSNGDLHFFWAQRVTYPNIGQVNGLWHSVWNDGQWSDFEAIVTGRKLIDLVGFSAFDPNTPNVAISRGNDVLVTWRTDRGSRGNGVWYSTTVLDAPQLPASPLPMVPSAPVVDNEVDKAEGDFAEAPEPTVEAVPELVDQLDIQDVAASGPTEGLLTSLVPVVFLILLIGVSYQLSQSRRL